MKKLIPIIFAALLLNACASNPNRTQVKDQSAPEVVINTSLKEAGDLAFWIIHGATTQSCADRFLAYGFMMERCAFGLAMTIMNEKEEAEQSDFMRMIHAAKDAGFYDELVYKIFSDESWFKQEGLQLQAFDTWYMSNEYSADFLVRGARASIIKPDNSKLNLSSVNIKQDFPVAIGEFIYKEEYDYEDLSLGKSLSFADREGSLLTVYVYPIGFKGYEENRDSAVSDGMTDLKRGILFATEQGKYSDLKSVREVYLNEIDTGMVQYSVINNGERFDTYGYISTLDKYYIKARATIPVELNKDYHEDVLKVLEAVKNSVQL